MAGNHALIGGGTGFIGQRLVNHLIKNGYDITVISRMPGMKRITWHQLEKKGIPSGINAVVNVAGQNVLDPTRRWTDGFKQNVWNSRINTTKALAKASVANSNVKVFVNLLGVSHYRDEPNKIYTENDPVEAYDFMSKLCVEWENAATIPADVFHKCRVVKLRTGVVVGREGGMIQSMWLPFKLGLGGPLGNGKQTLPWIHIEDLCSLIQHCIENDTCEGVVNGVAPQLTTNAEFAKAFAKALHRPCLLSVPEIVVKTVFGDDRSALLLNGAKVRPKCAMDNGFTFKYGTAQEACEEVTKSHYE